MKQEPINPENVDLKALAESPLADPVNINVPFGKRPAKRGKRFQHYESVPLPKLTGREVEERRTDGYSKKLCAVLDYYASSSVPIERVAEHTSLSIEDATAAMRRRGRKI